MSIADIPWAGPCDKHYSTSISLSSRKVKYLRGGGGGSEVSAKPLRNLLPAPVAQALTGKEMLMPQVNNDSFLAGSVRYG